MQCLGRTKTLKRCKNKAKFAFCNHHWYQPLILLVVTIPTLFVTYFEIYKIYQEFFGIGKVTAVAPYFKGFSSLDKNFKVLLLPFRPLEESYSKKVHIEEIIEKEIQKSNINNINKISIKFDSTAKIFTSDFDIGRDKGYELGADMVIWGDLSEKCYPETSKTCIRYCVTKQIDRVDKKTGIGLVTDVGLGSGVLNHETPTRLVPDLSQVGNGYLLKEVSQILLRIYASNEYNRDNYENALKYFNMINIEDCPEKSTIFYYKGLCHMMIPLARTIPTIGRNDSAIFYFNKALELNPYLTGAYLNKGYCEFYSMHLYDLYQDYQNALNDFNKVIELDTENELGYFNRAIVKEYLNDLDGAFFDYSVAIKINPLGFYSYRKRAIVLGNLGYIVASLSDYFSAFYTFKESHMGGRTLSFLYEERGYIFGYLGIFNYAIQDLEDCVNLGLLPKWRLKTQRSIEMFKKRLHAN